jgi:hypothetical protein
VYNFECDKRVINWVTLQTYPYGYFWIDNNDNF